MVRRRCVLFYNWINIYFSLVSFLFLTMVFAAGMVFVFRLSFPVVFGLFHIFNLFLCIVFFLALFVCVYFYVSQICFIISVSYICPLLSCFPVCFYFMFCFCTSIYLFFIFFYNLKSNLNCNSYLIQMQFQWILFYIILNFIYNSKSNFNTNCNITSIAIWNLIWIPISIRARLVYQLSWICFRITNFPSPYFLICLWHHHEFIFLMFFRRPGITALTFF